MTNFPPLQKVPRYINQNISTYGKVPLYEPPAPCNVSYGNFHDYCLLPTYDCKCMDINNKLDRVQNNTFIPKKN